VRRDQDTDEPERVSKARAQRNEDFKSSRFKIFRAKRLCELFDVNNSTIWHWRKDGILPEPAFQQGGIEGWTEDQLAALFKERGVGGGDA
jgi:hypothetical protein